MARSKLLFLVLSLASTAACTTRVVTTTSTDGGGPSAAPNDTSLASSDDESATDEPDADLPSPEPNPQPESKPKPDGGTTTGKDAGSGSVGRTPSGGSITLTCPSTGFHQNPPITVASVPKSLLPRCSATTKACWQAADTSAEVDACLAADTTPAATLGGEPLDCAGCERAQGAYCMASACKSEFAAYGCCAQSKGEAACSNELDAVVDCAGTKGKPAFTNCLAGLVPQCFP